MGVARRRLLNMCQEHFVVARHQISDSLTFLNGYVKVGQWKTLRPLGPSWAIARDVM